MKHLFFIAFVCVVAVISCQKEQLQSSAVANTTTGTTNNETASGLTYNAATATYTLTLQPGPADGDDLWMKHWVNHPSYADTNDAKVALIKGLAYNLDKTLVLTRSLIKFDSLVKVPVSAKVISATLYLFGPKPNSKDVSVHLPMGNTSYPGSTKGDNTCFLQRVTSNWDIHTISWNNPPTATTVGEYTMPASDKQWQYDVAMDVTGLIKPMISTPAQNNGLLLRLKTEQQPRAMGFLSSNSPEAARRPKLVVIYSK